MRALCAKKRYGIFYSETGDRIFKFNRIVVVFKGSATIFFAGCRRLTHLFASYCQYHCDARFEHKALAFLDSLLTSDVSGVQTFSGRIGPGDKNSRIKNGVYICKGRPHVIT